jgi:hypothetical protein
MAPKIHVHIYKQTNGRKKEIKMVDQPISMEAKPPRCKRGEEMGW